MSVPARFQVATLCVGCLLLTATAVGASPFAEKGTIPSRTYQNACADCHDKGGFAVRVLSDRPAGSQSPLIDQRGRMNPALIRAAVRHGLGAMPPMSKIEVSDAELDQIVAYLARDVDGVGRR